MKAKANSFIQMPGTHIAAHCGPSNYRLRLHLGLSVPRGCRIRVGDEVREWRAGECLIFDDSFEHEVWHDGSGDRIVLIVDAWHPMLDVDALIVPTLSPSQRAAFDAARRGEHLPLHKQPEGLVQSRTPVAVVGA